MFGLGELEGAIMDVLWRLDKQAKVRDVRERLDTGKKLAYTTVMTVLDHLHRKGWVSRELRGKAYLYQPTLAREEAAARALREVLDASGDPKAALLLFTNSTSDEEAAVLRAALGRKDHRE